MKKLSISKIIIGIFTVLLTLSLIFFLAAGIQQIKDVDYNPSYYNEEQYIFYLETEDYMGLLNMTDQDSKLDKSYSQAVIQCKAVAKYFEAATLYKAFLATTDTDSVRIQLQRMEQYAAEAGEFQEYIDKINTKLELGQSGE